MGIFRRKALEPHADPDIERDAGRVAGKLELVTDRLAEAVRRLEHEARIEDLARSRLDEELG